MILNLIFFLAAYLPFQLALNPSTGVDLASIRVLIISLFFLWITLGLKNKKIIIRPSLQGALIATFLFLNVLSVVMARNTDWSGRKLMFLFSIFPIYFIVSAVVNTQEKASKIVKILVLSGAAVAAIGIIQFLLQFVIGLEKTYKFWAEWVIVPFLGNTFTQAVLQNPSWLVNIAGNTYLRATSLFPDPHMFAFYLGLLIPLALGVAFVDKKKRIFWIISFGIMFAADLLTFSRGGYLGLFSGALAAVFFWWNGLGKKYKITAVFLAILVVSGLFVSNPVSQRFYSIFNLKEESNAGRIATWNQALKISEDNLLLGVGIGNYPLSIKASADYREPIYAHNTYLDIAVETGILNAFIWASLLAVAFWKFYVLGKKNILFLMSGVSVIIFAAHSAVETAVYSPTVLTLFLIIVSFSNIKTDDEKNT
jgi:O-antigen ligase